MAEGDTLANAVIGAIVGVVLAGFIPFSPVLGGAVSGYLQGGDREGAVKIGALAGGIMLIPMVLFVAVLGPVFLAIVGGMTGMGGMPGLGAIGFGGAVGLLFLVFALVFGLVYTVGFAALGGYLGNYVKYDTDVDL